MECESNTFLDSVVRNDMVFAHCVYYMNTDFGKRGASSCWERKGISVIESIPRHCNNSHAEDG